MNYTLQGYRYRQAYVATQGPLAETTEDYWRMLWEHNSTIIVMLTKLREMGRVSLLKIWATLVVIGELLNLTSSFSILNLWMNKKAVIYDSQTCLTMQ